MSLLIKNWSKADWQELLKWAKIGANNAMIGELTEVEEVPVSDAVEQPHWNLWELDEDEYSPLIASGVYVKGMKMPKDCPMCKLAHWDCNGDFCGCDITPGKQYAMLADKAYAESSTRPEWCPLVSVSEPPKDEERR